MHKQNEDGTKPLQKETGEEQKGKDHPPEETRSDRQKEREESAEHLKGPG